MLNQGIKSITRGGPQPPNSLESTEHLFHFTLSGAPETVTSKLVVSSIDFLQQLPNSSYEAVQVSGEQEITAYGIVIIKSPISLHSFNDPNVDDEQQTPDESEKMIDAGMLVFPPGELPSGKAPGAVNVLINGEGVSSCPRGQAILYFTTQFPSDYVSDGNREKFAESSLTPYLEATLSSIIPWQAPKTEAPDPPAVVFKAFFMRKASPSPFTTGPDNMLDSNIVVCPPLTSHIALSGDDAATKAETVFRMALKKLGVDGPDGSLPFWPPLENDGNDDDD